MNPDTVEYIESDLKEIDEVDESNVSEPIDDSDETFIDFHKRITKAEEEEMNA